MIRFLLLIFSLLLSFHGLYAQREYHITKYDVPPVIDGVLNEDIWNQTEIADNFTVNSPVFGAISRFESKIHMFYDDNAIYIGGDLHDPSPDSISYSLSQRDDTGNADWFGVSLDPYANSVNGFAFIVTAAGVEVDGLESSNGFDGTWNAVWKSAVSKTETGWSFEMKIPYSAIRFPNKKVQEWNLNFWREVRRNRERSHWNPIDPAVFGAITQSGRLKGIENVKSPLRLSFTPYATGYLENSYDVDLNQQTWKRRITGGMDVKYGLNDAFTLDMTLIPDFGQTTSDKQVLNLGPFEVRYNENRPFFLEGTDLFQIGGVFYSRRIGGAPFRFYEAYDNLNDSLGEQVVSNPDAAPLINGTKVSGRTKSGLGIGIFNSVEGRAHAIITDDNGNERLFKTNPLTNYNVFVLSQNLKNNSTVSFVNTNVMREGNYRDANVSLGQANIYTKNGKYRVSSTIKLSSITEGSQVFGHAGGASVAKVAGTWQYSFGYSEESDTFDPNDLGFLYNNNSRNYNAGVSWNDYKGSKRFFRRSVNFGWSYEELYKPQLFTYNGFSWRVGGLHKKQVYMNASGNFNPFGEVNHFESRQFGKEVKFNPSFVVRSFFTTDYSKKFALDGRFWLKQFIGRNQSGKGIYLSPRVRISNRMNTVLDFNVEFITNDYGYVSVLEDNGYNDQIILGVRDRMIIENSIRAEFIFTKRMGIDLRLRHYWQQVEYDHFLELQDDGVMLNSAYNPMDAEGGSEHSTNYNAFTVDVNYRWVFIPGSELRIVYKNNIFNSKLDLDPSYFRTFNTLFDQPQINSISMKLLVYIDAIYFRKKNRDKALGVR